MNDGIVIRSTDRYIARGVTWNEFEIEVDGFVVNDQASIDDVIDFLRAEQERRAR